MSHPNPVPIVACKGCNEPCHGVYIKKYDGYCFECWNRGAPERDELRRALVALWEWQKGVQELPPDEVSDLVLNALGANAS